MCQHQEAPLVPTSGANDGAPPTPVLCPQDAAEREALRLDTEAGNETGGGVDIDQGWYVYFERGFVQAVVFEREHAGLAVDVDESVIVRGELYGDGVDEGLVPVCSHVEE